MTLLKRLKSFCPQPPSHTPSKLKHYSTPVAAILTLILILTALSYFSSWSMVSHAVVSNQAQSTTSSSPSSTPPSLPASSNAQLIVMGGLVGVIVAAFIFILVVVKKPKNNKQGYTPQNVVRTVISLRLSASHVFLTRKFNVG